RHRRPSFLLEIERGRGTLERDPARRFPAAAAALAHLLRRKVLLISAACIRGAAGPRDPDERGLHPVVRLGESPADPATAHLPRMGPQPVRRAALGTLLPDLY